MVRQDSPTLDNVSFPERFLARPSIRSYLAELDIVVRL